MDFPVFHIDFFGNRMLIAVIAILHVLINHGLAVGMAPLVATLELIGFKTKNQEYDRIAYKIMFFAFVITTTIGALTGVGIWFSVALVNPYSISSLIRVFFWAWFFEWTIFCTEVVLILYYFLTWKSSNVNAKSKKRHIVLGYGLAFFSWITMAVIVAILGFMMDPGTWVLKKSFFSAVFNDIYIPQLALRTPLAMVEAGCIAMALILLFAKKDVDAKRALLKLVGIWNLFWSPLLAAGGYFYYSRIPSTMKDNIPLSLLTGDFVSWHDKLIFVVIVSLFIAVLVSQLAILIPERLPFAIPLIPMFCILWLTGHFERVREFIRKPYVIGRYMYANGVRVADQDFLEHNGISNYMTYQQPLNEKEAFGLEKEMINRVTKGKNIFLFACSRCHTGKGINSVIVNFEKLLGKGGNWLVDDVANYVKNVHMIQSYMPPFPGNAQDALDLASYIVVLKKNNLGILGAQTEGVGLNPEFFGYGADLATEEGMFIDYLSKKLNLRNEKQSKPLVDKGADDKQHN